MTGAADGRRYALRLHRPGYHSRAAIVSELAWAQALRSSGVVSAPHPVPGRDGALIQSLGHPALEAPRALVLFDWETGAEPVIGNDLSRLFGTLGGLAARMHRHARRWPRPPGFTRLTWDFETSLGEAAPHWGRWRDGLGLTPDAEALFARTVALIGRRLAAYGKGPERFGLIHGDLRLANLLVDGDAVKVIDFDDCGFGWFMYDAATPVSFHEEAPQVPDLIAAWIDGYRQEAPSRRRTRPRSRPSSCCAGCCSSPGSPPMPRPSSRSRWACPIPKGRRRSARPTSAALPDEGSPAPKRPADLRAQPRRRKS